MKTPEVEAEKITAKAEIVYGDFCIGVHGENFSMQFDKREGGVSSLIYDGKEYITRAPKISFFRAYTDNDAGAGYPYENAQWQIAGRCAKLLGFETKENADSLEVTLLIAPTVPSFEHKVTYIAYFDGRLGVKAEYDGVMGLSDMPIHNGFQNEEAVRQVSFWEWDRMKTTSTEQRCKTWCVHIKRTGHSQIS